eukprot:COSAG06_NODE_59834_length_273_cov_0.557471_1_plen_52_part_10
MEKTTKNPPLLFLLWFSLCFASAREFFPKKFAPEDILQKKKGGGGGGGGAFC